MKLPASRLRAHPFSRPVLLLSLGGILAPVPALRADFVIRVQTPDGECPAQIQVTLDGVPATAERKSGCDWWMHDDAEDAHLTVRASGYLDEIRRLDVEPHAVGMVAIRLTPLDDLLDGLSGEIPPGVAAAGDGHGHSHGGDEAIAERQDGAAGGSEKGVSGTVALRLRPDPMQADALASGGAFGRTVNQRRKTAGIAVSLRTALFNERLFVQTGYAPVWWTERALYEPPAQPDLAGIPVTVRQTDGLAARLENAYFLDLRWLPGAAHELTASIRGVSSDREGLLHGVGDRLSPILNPGLNETVDNVASGQATRGRDEIRATTAALGYTFRHGAYEAGLWVRDYHARAADHPASGSDFALFVDRRRDQVHAIQLMNGFRPVVPLEQVRFGGYGIFMDEASTRRRTWGLRLAGRFGAAGRLTSEFRAQSADATLRERLLYSGRRGDQGALLHLDFDFTGPIRETFFRVRGGVSAAVICSGLIVPQGASLESACPSRAYLITRGEVGPPPADLQLRTDRVEWISRWQGKRQSLALTLEARRDKVLDPTDYTILGALTGTPLLGLNNEPVGTYDPDVPPDSVGRPSPHRLIAGPGRFIGGSYQFPLEPGWKIEWQKLLGESDRLTASWSRSPEDPPETLLHHLYEARLSVVESSYRYPDQTGANLGFVFGGALRRVAPGTRLGSHEDFRLTWQAGGWLPLGLTVELFQRRQSRILAHTQANALENVVNTRLDAFFFQDSQGGRNYCLNCPPNQSSAFPNYVPGITTGDVNPDARGLLSLTLANPGHNTDRALFGNPKRNSHGLRFSVVRAPPPGGRLTARLSGQWSRTRGNFDGMQLVGDDQEHPGPRTLFDYPISTMTRSQYAMGPLTDEFPSYMRLNLRWERLWLDGLTAAFTAEWREGSLRTPWLALPLTTLDGNLPGTSPDYFRLDMDGDGYADRLVLRDFTPARRGALGRNDGQLRFDAALLYRQPRGRLAWRAGLAVINLLNSHPVSSRDDRLEVPIALHRDVARPAPDGPLHSPTRTDFTTRIPNPDYAHPYRHAPPRTIQLLFAIDF